MKFIITDKGGEIRELTYYDEGFVRTLDFLDIKEPQIYNEELDAYEMSEDAYESWKNFIDMQNRKTKFVKRIVREILKIK